MTQGSMGQEVNPGGRVTCELFPTRAVDLDRGRSRKSTCALQGTSSEECKVYQVFS